MELHNVEQRSKEWFDLRLGKVGGSEAINLTTPARMKNLVNVKLAEILTGQAEQVFVNDAMQYGIDTEPIVVSLYEKEQFISTTEIGGVSNKDYPRAFLSPDRLVGNNGALEIKCPQPKSYIDMVLNAYNETKIGFNKIPSVYRPQLATYFLIMPNLEWVDFVAYNEFVSLKAMLIIRVNRLDADSEIKKLKAGHTKFESKINDGLKHFING